MVVSSFIFVFVVQFPTSIACWKHVKPCLKKWSLMLKSRKKDTPLVWSNQTIFFCFFFRNALPIFFFEFTSPYAEEISWNLHVAMAVSTWPWLAIGAPQSHGALRGVGKGAAPAATGTLQSHWGESRRAEVGEFVEDPYGWCLLNKYYFIARYSRWT